MPWIKKNLSLVLGGLAGLLLLGAAGYFWWSQRQRETDIGAQLEAKVSEWDELTGRKPYPSDANIEAVRAEQQRLAKLRTRLKEAFSPLAAEPVRDSLELKVLMESTIAQLQDEAEAAGVALPQRNYAFTFERLRPLTQYESNAIPQLAEQVAEVAVLARTLFGAKVHHLDAIRRATVLKEEGGTADYLAAKPQKDDLINRVPYEVTFRSFAAELAAVVSALATLPQTVVVKSINVEPTTIQMPQRPPPVFLPPPTAAAPLEMPPETDPMARYRGGPGRGMDPGMAARYGLGGPRPGGMDPALAARYGLTPGASPGGMPPPPGALPGAPASPSVAVDEKPLRATLQLDFVRLNPDPAAR